MGIPNHYKLVKEHKDSYEMHDSRDQSNFHIAKKDLKSSMHKQIKEVQKFSSGGEVANETEVIPDKGYGKIIRVGMYEGGPVKEHSWVDSLESNAASLGSKINNVFGGNAPIQAVQPLSGKDYNMSDLDRKIKQKPTPTTFAGSEGNYNKGGKVQRYAFGGGPSLTPEQQAALSQSLGVDQAAPSAPAQPTIDPNDPYALAQAQKQAQDASLMSALPVNPKLSLQNGEIVDKPQSVDVSQLAGAPAGAAAPAQGTSVQGAQAVTKPFDLASELAAANQHAESAIGLQQGADITKSQNMDKLYQQQQMELQKMASDHDSKLKTLNDRSNDLFQSIQNGKVDPENYWKNHSRVAASLGILISGIGAGLQKSTTNLAMQSIQNDIEKEIQSQKDNLNTKNNLYKMNLEQTHDANQAYAQTKSDLLTMAAAKAGQIAAAAGTPEALSRAEAMKANLGNQTAQLHQSIATAGIANQAYTKGIPVAAVTLLHPDQQKRMVPMPDGTMADAGSDKSAETVKETLAPINEVNSALDRLDKISKMAILPGPEQARARVEAIQITNSLQKMAEQKRFSDDAIEYQVKQFSNPANLEDILQGSAATDQLKKSLAGKMDAVYRANVPAFSLKKQSETKIPFKKND